MADLLIDTDVLVDHLRGAHKFVAGAEAIFYSVVTRAELFAGRESEERRIRQLLGPFKELPVDRIVAERAGRLRRASTMRLPDALIAATALEHGLDLVTRNVADFGSVPELILRAPTGRVRG